MNRLRVFFLLGLILSSLFALPASAHKKESAERQLSIVGNVNAALSLGCPLTVTVNAQGTVLGLVNANLAAALHISLPTTVDAGLFLAICAGRQVTVTVTGDVVGLITADIAARLSISLPCVLNTNIFLAAVANVNVGRQVAVDVNGNVLGLPVSVSLNLGLPTYLVVNVHGDVLGLVNAQVLAALNLGATLPIVVDASVFIPSLPAGRLVTIDVHGNVLGLVTLDVTAALGIGLLPAVVRADIFLAGLSINANVNVGRQLLAGLDLNLLNLVHVNLALALGCPLYVNVDVNGNVLGLVNANVAAVLGLGSLPVVVDAKIFLPALPSRQVTIDVHGNILGLITADIAAQLNLALPLTVDANIFLAGLANVNLGLSLGRRQVAVNANVLGLVNLNLALALGCPTFVSVNVAGDVLGLVNANVAAALGISLPAVVDAGVFLGIAAGRLVTVDVHGNILGLITADIAAQLGIPSIPATINANILLAGLVDLDVNLNLGGVLGGVTGLVGGLLGGVTGLVGGVVAAPLPGVTGGSTYGK